MKYYKVLDPGGKACWGGSGTWHLPENGKPGKWMKRIWFLMPCSRGYHLCTRLNIWWWLKKGAEIWEAEYRGRRINEDNKIVVSKARLIRKVGVVDQKTTMQFQYSSRNTPWNSPFGTDFIDFLEKQNTGETE